MPLSKWTKNVWTIFTCSLNIGPGRVFHTGICRIGCAKKTTPREISHGRLEVDGSLANQVHTDPFQSSFLPIQRGIIQARRSCGATAVREDHKPTSSTGSIGCVSLKRRLEAHLNGMFRDS